MITKKSHLAGLVLLLAAVFAVSGLALANETAAFKKYSKIVDTEFVSQVVEGKEKGLVVDSRPARKKYDMGHIPGSINIPFSAFAKMTDKLPKDKDALLVFYCGGLKCPLSHKSAFAAEKLGYTNIRVYASGYPSWKAAFGPGPNALAEKLMATKPSYKVYPDIVDAAFVKQMVEGKKLGLLIDSRPKRKKYDMGHIPGSLSMPYSGFEKAQGLLPADKGALVVFYCEGFKCPLSHNAAHTALTLGYKNVKVYAAGYPEWAKLYGGGETIAKAKATDEVAVKKAEGPLKSGPSEGSVDPAYFADVLSTKPDSILVVDVRDAAEYKKATIKGAINIPTEELEAKLTGGWNPGKPVVFVCATGARSGEALYMVWDLREDLKNQVYYLDGEVTYDGKGGYKFTPPK